ncbi:hypothetical protein [Acaryochloris marina]|uniref:Uncharacterized protein n=1 Tax=Acaryochloris marina (strain MBIC 11017) TaxID=329726 RepID=A8ZQ02_ACAM1|nr:hypothetical protein [Acaryochloris marina]ABW33163.1 hypothetical protein AM1_F0019 [Acaryochloris marina MBIC11017]BDM83227.1 hypothetical protein AM10699_60880 [Acaryochloris marina MBIC10699]
MWLNFRVADESNLDWQALKTLTEYCREDIKGFFEDEGFQIYPGRLHPYQALFLSNFFVQLVGTRGVLCLLLAGPVSL